MRTIKIILSILLIATFFLVISYKPTTVSDEPPTTIEINIPDYIKTKMGSFDYVTIPGGVILTAEEGRPLVPTYSKSITYPGNYKIQDVVLKEKLGLKVEQGLKLPTVTLGYTPENPAEMKPGIYPQLDYTWKSLKNTDGTYTINIIIYPVSYDPETLKLTFYKHYEFEVKYITSSVEIKSVTTDKYAYKPKDILKADIYINNPGASQDLILAPVIKQYGSEKVVDGLPLKSLKDFTGNAMVSLEWDTKETPYGYYVIEVTLFDKSNNYLDKNTADFFIGETLVNTTGFSVLPKHFSIGDNIDINLKFKNDGTVKISGNCIFRVTDLDNIVKEFSHTFTDLSPGSTLEFSYKWDTTGAKKGTQYKIIGFVSYSGRTTPPQVEIISTNLLPTANFNYLLEKCIVNKDITFDASVSSDSDGSIASFEWDFGDGAISQSKIVTHRFLRTGSYNVTLTVTDNEGGSGSITKKITIVQEVIPPSPPPPSETIVIRLYIDKTIYYVNDVEKEMDAAPIIKESRTLLPIRYVAEALGAVVQWDAVERKVTITFKETTIELWIDKNTALVNGEYKLIDSTNPKVVPVIIPPGRTMLPIRFIAENLGCRVDWDPTLREVKVTYPAE
jgi:PKD repeat protein